jgi:hypothetical protein
MTTTTDTHITKEELLKVVVSVGSVQRLYKESQFRLWERQAYESEVSVT